MKPQLREYLLTTLFGQLFIILILSPWLIWIVGLSFDEYIVWLWQGSLIGLILPYGLLKWIQFWMKKINGITVKGHG